MVDRAKRAVASYRAACGSADREPDRNGGLAAAFDGNTLQPQAACASSGSDDGYIGKTFVTPAVFGRATIYGSSDIGFSTGNPTVSLSVYGKNGAAPASPSDGTLISDVDTFTNYVETGTGRVLLGINTSAWEHIWLRVQVLTGTQLRVAEIVASERVDDPGGPILTGATTGTVFVEGMEAGMVYRRAEHVVTSAGL